MIGLLAMRSAGTRTHSGGRPAQGGRFFVKGRLAGVQLRPSTHRLGRDDKGIYNLAHRATGI